MIVFQIFSAIGVVIFLVLLKALISLYSVWVVLILLAAVALSIWGYVTHIDKAAVKQRENEEKFEKAALESIQILITQHIGALSLKYDQTAVKDEYGNWNFRGWYVARKYFIDNVLLSNADIWEYLDSPLVHIDIRQSRTSRIESKINDSIYKYQALPNFNKKNLSAYIDDLDPIQFENQCAELLRQSGWNARVTKASGDQGVDVVATYNGYKVVLQCKKYSKPVGNAAVQEISAGKLHEQAHAGAVVSNASYTPSAKQLANSTGIHLLHYSELPQLAERLGLT